MRKASLLLVLALTACAAQPPAYLPVCPVAPVYTKAFEQAAAAQLVALPPDSPLVVMTEDYIKVRKQIAECQK